jgi:hypothetical protein
MLNQSVNGDAPYCDRTNLTFGSVLFEAWIATSGSET